MVRSPIKILSFPAHGNADENAYLDILFNAIRAEGVEVVEWNKHLSLAHANIFHVHWPELIIDIRKRRFQRGRGDIILWNFFNTIARLKRHGGKVVWTVHDIKPHRPDILVDPAYVALMDRFIPEVDGVVSLTEFGKEAILKSYPAFIGRPMFVTPHPHYRDHINGSATASGARQCWSPLGGRIVFGFLGTLRANKGAADVVRSVTSSRDAGLRLLVAGAANAEQEALVRGLAADDPRIQLRLERLSVAQMQAAYRAIDVLVFPPNDYFNSGTIITALSHNVPVLAAATPTNIELQRMVGKNWLHLFDGTIDADVLKAAEAAFTEIAKSAICDLSLMTPTLSARRTIEAYDALLEGF